MSDPAIFVHVEAELTLEPDGCRPEGKFADAMVIFWLDRVYDVSVLIPFSQ